MTIWALLPSSRRTPDSRILPALPCSSTATPCANPSRLPRSALTSPSTPCSPSGAEAATRSRGPPSTWYTAPRIMPNLRIAAASVTSSPLASACHTAGWSATGCGVHERKSAGSTASRLIEVPDTLTAPASTTVALRTLASSPRRNLVCLGTVPGAMASTRGGVAVTLVPARARSLTGSFTGAAVGTSWSRRGAGD